MKYKAFLITLSAALLATWAAAAQTCYDYGGIVQCTQPLQVQPRGSFSNGLNSGLGALNTQQQTDYWYEKTRDAAIDFDRKLLEMRRMCGLPENREAKVCEYYR